MPATYDTLDAANAYIARLEGELAATADAARRASAVADRLRAENTILQAQLADLKNKRGSSNTSALAAALEAHRNA